MMRPTPLAHRGTVTLVALCFTTVLGLVLASYLTLCSRAMTLSNRTFHTNLSRQLAEMGIEEALRAFNKGDWSGWAANPTNVTGGTTAWTLDTTNKRATRTITFSSPKFGQGVSATVKIRVDNYDANQLGATYDSLTTYRRNDLVGYNGTWYRSVQNSPVGTAPSNASGYPNLAYWVPAPISWMWSANIAYSQHDVVNYNGAWYRYINASSTSANLPSTNPTYWTLMQAPSIWSSTTTYTQNSFAYYLPNHTWYRYINASSSSGNLPPSNPSYWSNASTTTPTISWVYRSSATYHFNDLVFYNANWYRCIATSTSDNPTGSVDWENALTGPMYGWNGSSLNYTIRDVVYYGGQWYRCIRAHTSSGTITPANTTYWASTPGYSTAWDSDRQYSRYDTVRHNGIWYLSYSPSNQVSQNPATPSSSYWIGANTDTASYQWKATTAYSVGDYKCYGGAWYKCIAATTANGNQTPNNQNYWTATWTNSFGVTTGTPVVYAEGSVIITGNSPVRTQLRASLTPASLFPNAAGAATDLTITTGTGTVDSYDSNVSAYDASSAGYSAVLAAGTTLAISGTTSVRGYLAWPSPPAGISTNTTVWGPSSPASPKVDTSRVSRSPNIPQFSSLPASGLATAFTDNNFRKGTGIPDPPSSNLTLNLGTPGASVPAIYYYDGSLQVRSSAFFTNYYQTININGPVILYIRGDLRLHTNGAIYINSEGLAEIHVRDEIRVESTSHGIVNRSPNSTNPDPKKLILVSDSSSTSAQYYNETDNDFYGVVYVPNTATASGFTVGNAGAGVVIHGAVSASKITFANEATLHYDTSLRYATFGGVDQPYTVDQWRELPVTEQATMP